MIPELAQLRNYFEEVWIGKCEKKNNKEPLFEHSLWSCHALLEEQGYQHMKLDHQFAGYKEPETKRYKDKNERLANVVKQFTQEWNETEDYCMQVLHQIAYNL
ncbi:hypothetical protein Zmor_016229 [Zophobas morio]|uniref:Uncharacterized protein n=1 Tax=Zophobas morio TaxID=2755281 RepID=A0AA38IKW8_9CUCU|nr:hypothetical protein Zmor_016229 [Zophobas morio]